MFEVDVKCDGGATGGGAGAGLANVDLTQNLIWYTSFVGNTDLE